MNSPSRDHAPSITVAAPTALLNAHFLRISLVRAVGDPLLTTAEAQMVLRLYEGRGAFVSLRTLHCDLPPQSGMLRERPDGLIFRVWVNRIRSKTRSDYILSEQGQGYALGAPAVSQLDALFGVKAAA